MEELDQQKPMSPEELAQRHVFEMEQAVAAEKAAAANNENDSPDKPLLSNFKGWMASSIQKHAPKAVAAKATSLLKLGPLSLARRNKAATAATAANNNNNDEEFQVMSSSNVLGDDDLVALNRIKESQSASLCSSVVKIINGARKNPREAFILFTLVLAIIVYFYSRKKEIADDVQ